uniref:Uncharacterized protein n=1 Tax=Paramormyrops kingsleyae TaxID=1676925 RepID=A0A3B3R466_9TELE
MTAEFCAVLGLSFKNNGMGPLNQQMEMRHGPFASMDDFDYSVHIAERDWSTFLQECDECDVLQGTLASLDDSGMSDNDSGMEVEELQPQPSSNGQLNLQGSSLNTSDFQVPDNGEEEDFSSQKVTAREESSAILDCSDDVSVTMPMSTCHPECQNCIDHQDILEIATESNDTSSSAAKGNVCHERHECLSGLMDPKQGDGRSSNEQMGNQLFPQSVFLPSEDSPTDSLTRKEMISESPENFTSGTELPKKEKERWFVTVDVGVARSRARGSAPVKKKKKKKICRVSCELGLKCEDTGPAIRSKPELKAPATQSTDQTNESSLSSHQLPTCTPKNCSFFIKLLSEKPATHKSPKSTGIVPSETCKNGNTLQKLAKNCITNRKSNAIHHELSCTRESIDTSLSGITKTELKEPNNSLYLSMPAHGKTLAYATCKQEGIPVQNIQQGIKLSHSTGKTELKLLALDSNNEYEKYEHKKLNRATSFKECEGNNLTKKDVDGILSAKCILVSPRDESNSVFLSEDLRAGGTTAHFNSVLNPTGNTLSPTTVNKNIHVDVRESHVDSALLQVTGVQHTMRESYSDEVVAGIYNSQNHNEILDEVDCSGSCMTNRVFTIDEPEKNEENHPKQDRNVHILNMNKFTDSTGLPLLDPVETKAHKPQSDFRPTHRYQTNCSTKTESSLSQEPMTLDPEHPVYAISSFWDEMEKLTISDILQLKLVGHTYSPQTFPHIQDNVVVDTSDADDAGYFTNVDEFKPDCSMAEVPTFSDFGEKGSHSLNSLSSTPEPQDTKNRRSSDTLILRDDVRNKQLYLNAGTEKESKKRTKSCAENPFPHLHCSNVCQHGFNQKRPQNCKTAYQMNNVDDGNSNSLSVPEMYDYFLFESKPSNFCSSLIKNNETVPIFSSSQSIRQSLQFPEVYDCLLPDDSLIQLEDEEDRTPIRVVTRFDSRISDLLNTEVVPDSYEHFCTDSDWRGNLFWRHPLSFRRTCFTWRNFGQLWYNPVFGRIEAIRGRQSLCTTIRSNISQDVQHCGADICYLEKHIFSGLAEREQAIGKLQTALSVPRKMGCLLLRKQSDVCLVCIAFASWLLRSAEPQNVDTWRNGMYILQNQTSL